MRAADFEKVRDMLRRMGHESDLFALRVGVCPDYKMRKQIVSYRSKNNVAA